LDEAEEQQECGEHIALLDAPKLPGVPDLSPSAEMCSERQEPDVS
jgi:hypothetical protein